MLKPQGIPILLKTHLWRDRQWRYSDLAESLGMSASEVHSSLKRSTTAKLYNPLTHQPLNPHLLELLKKEIILLKLPEAELMYSQPRSCRELIHTNI